MKFLSTWLRNNHASIKQVRLDPSSMKFLSTWLRNHYGIGSTGEIHHPQ